MDRTLLKDFWNCGDNQIIEFAIIRARLNKKEQETIQNLLDECRTQEETAEVMNISTRCLQQYWYSASDKLLSIPWVVAYAEAIRKKER